MRVRMTRAARQDVIAAARAYEQHQITLGDYFVACMQDDLSRLRVVGGVHAKSAHGFHRMPTRRFPFVVYYLIREDMVAVVAVLDCRKDPRRIESILRSRRRVEG